MKLAIGSGNPVEIIPSLPMSDFPLAVCVVCELRKPMYGFKLSVAFGKKISNAFIHSGGEFTNDLRKNRPRK